MNKQAICICHCHICIAFYKLGECGHEEDIGTNCSCEHCEIPMRKRIKPLSKKEREQAIKKGIALIEEIKKLEKPLKIEKHQIYIDRSIEDQIFSLSAKINEIIDVINDL